MKIFHLYRDVTITSEGPQILIYTRDSWPISNEVSLTCHTYCDTGQPCHNEMKMFETST